MLVGFCNLPPSTTHTLVAHWIYKRQNFESIIAGNDDIHSPSTVLYTTLLTAKATIAAS